MAVSRNDWDIIDSYSSSRLVPLRWITGKVRSGDAHTILDALGERFNREVEPIIRSESWGYAQRDVRGNKGIVSEHNTGTAVDFNATKHPIGKRNTFSAAKQAKIRQIVRDFDGAIRWGGEWQRADDMHFELIGGVKKLKQVADKLKAGSKPTGDVKPTSPSKPVPMPSNTPSKAYTDWVKELQRNLNLWKTDLPKLRVDGDYGTLTKNRVKEWQRRNKGGAYKGIYLDGDAGPLTCAGLKIKNAPKK